MKNHIYFRFVGAVALLLILSSCKEGKDENTAPRHYPTEILSPVSRTGQVQYPALLKGRQSVEIRPQCSGLITRICIEEGACVRKGQNLFIIDQAPYLAALNTASANVSQAGARLATARLTLDSKEMLFKENVISDYELQTARNELKVAEATLEQMQAQYSNARTELSYTKVKSPVDGVAGMIPYRVGALVDRNITEPLVRVGHGRDVRLFLCFGKRRTGEECKAWDAENQFSFRQQSNTRCGWSHRCSQRYGGCPNGNNQRPGKNLQPGQNTV